MDANSIRAMVVDPDLEAPFEQIARVAQKLYRDRAIAEKAVLML